MNMDYELVELPEKKVLGFSAGTNNHSPQMQPTISGLWQQFFQKANGLLSDNVKIISGYTQYATDETGDYTAFVGVESQAEPPAENMTTFRVPQGPYAKFILKGKMTEIIPEFWSALWNMKLPRAFTFDFEEYQNSDMEQSEIHVYIALIK